MRLLFERDLTPHPQYAAFYKWLHLSLKPDCLIHFGTYPRSHHTYYHLYFVPFHLVSISCCCNMCDFPV